MPAGAIGIAPGTGIAVYNQSRNTRRRMRYTQRRVEAVMSPFDQVGRARTLVVELAPELWCELSIDVCCAEVGRQGRRRCSSTL